jgi:hypothetical protein
MEDRADTLRRRMAHYRRLLADGIVSDLALHLFAELASDEAELAMIERRDAAHRDEPNGAMKSST